MIWLVSVEVPIQSLVQCSGLRIWHCCSCGIGHSSGSDLTPGLRTPYALGAAKKEKRKKKVPLALGERTCLAKNVCMTPRSDTYLVSSVQNKKLWKVWLWRQQSLKLSAGPFWARDPMQLPRSHAVRLDLFSTIEIGYHWGRKMIMNKGYLHFFLIWSSFQCAYFPAFTQQTKIWVFVFVFVFYFVLLFSTALVAYGGSQARDGMGAIAAGLHPQQFQIPTTSVTYTTAHGHTRSPTHWAMPGIESTSSWILQSDLF